MLFEKLTFPFHFQSQLKIAVVEVAQHNIGAAKGGAEFNPMLFFGVFEGDERIIHYKHHT